MRELRSAQAGNAAKHSRRGAGKLVWAAACVLLFAGANAARAAVPEFAVTTAGDGAFHVYSTYTQTSATQYTVQDANLSAVVTDLGNNTWQLTIQAKVALRSPYFPWQTNRTPLDSDISNDYYYFPYIMGMSEKASAHNADYTWWGLEYPGSAHAPLVVMADPNSAIIVAAANWPPKSVTPMYAAQRLILSYNDAIAAGTSATYGAVIARVTGNEATGVVPWQLALDQYRAWLNTKISTPAYPSWMWDGQGIFNVQLQNAPFSTTSIDNTWQPIKSLYPWILFWGQMTTTAGGCCELNQTMSSTYNPALPNYVSSTVVGAGYHAGYYSAPYYSSSTGNLDTSSGVNWLTSWLTANQGYKANSYYIDTLGRQYYGDPAQIVNLFNAGTIPNTAMIEGTADIYPVPGLISGAMVGDINLCGAPQKTPADATKTTFPRFGRYLLGDRLLYSGQSNTDWRFWGSGAWTSTSDGGINSSCGYSTWCSTHGPCAYGAERMSFVLGTKLDVMQPNNNPILNAVIAERQRVNWWARRPVYLDTKGLDLTGIPAGSAVEIRRFKDQNGATLIAVSNPNSAGGLSFKVDGTTTAVPTQAITILDLGTTGPTTTNTAPVVSAGSPSGALPAGTTSTTMTVTTNEAATCRYATTAGVAYSAMTTTFATTGGTLHSTPLTALQSGAYSYYVRCSDASGAVDTTDYVVQFSVAASTSTADTTPPVVSLTSPTPGQTVSGQVQFAATATDNVGVAKVQFTVDGYAIAPPVLAAPYTATWDSSTATPGTHTVRAAAWDAANNYTVSQGVTITVAAPTTGAATMTIAVTAPTAGQNVSGAVQFAATTTGSVSKVQFTVDGYAIAPPILAAPYTTTWNSASIAPGSHAVRAAAWDAAGNNVVSAPVTINVTAPLSITVTAPTAGQTITGTVQFAATTVGSVSKVQFTVDGYAIAPPDSSSPYTANWNSKKLANGSHAVRAALWDSAGNYVVSAPVTIYINNR